MDYRDRLPAAWYERGDVFIHMFQCEALWLGFHGAYWKPNAVKVGTGNVNAISGASWDEDLCTAPQDYLVCPNQPWLDGFNSGNGFVRQFVATPLGEGRTVEAQLTGVEEFGGIQITVFEAKPGRFPDEPPSAQESGVEMPIGATRAVSHEMGLGAGGKLRQHIYPDPYGSEVWVTQNRGHLRVHILNSERYRWLTGLALPPTPISLRTYLEQRLPWFAVYDEGRGDIAATQRLAAVDPIDGLASGETLPDIDVSKLPLRKVDGGRGGRDD